MKNYTITVNGNVYDVTVEEKGEVSKDVRPAAAPVVPQVSKPVVTPAAMPAPASVPAAGSVKVNAPMPGKIVGVKAAPGDVVKRGQVILVLEAMKMENDIAAPSDGTIASIPVAVGATVEAGEVIATLN